jgi:ABC-type methionine transport system ATPase subunit
MADFAAAGTTLVFASHNLGQVKRLATRVVYLEQGRVLADLPVRAFFTGPLGQTSREAEVVRQGRTGMNFARRTLCAFTLALAACGGTWAQSTLVMASTTSTEQSGLFSHLLPEFARASGITVKVVAVGTGQAIDLARRGDADVLFVHDRAAEEKFVAEVSRRAALPVMYNDFVPGRAEGRPGRRAGQGHRRAR